MVIWHPNATCYKKWPSLTSADHISCTRMTKSLFSAVSMVTAYYFNLLPINVTSTIESVLFVTAKQFIIQMKAIASLYNIIMKNMQVSSFAYN